MGACGVLKSERRDRANSEVRIGALDGRKGKKNVSIFQRAKCTRHNRIFRARARRPRASPAPGQSKKAIRQNSPLLGVKSARFQLPGWSTSSPGWHSAIKRRVGVGTWRFGTAAGVLLQGANEFRDCSVLLVPFLFLVDPRVVSCSGKSLPTRRRLACVWTLPSLPSRDYVSGN
jgi:hypothetical protein